MTNLGEIERNIVLLKQGNIDGLTKLYELTKHSVFMTAFVILRDYSKAEDIMQETFVRVSNSISQYKKGTNFKAWVTVIARNCALKELNKNKAICNSDELDNIVFSQETQQSIENKMMLKAAFKCLDKDERQVVVLYAIEGFKHREIADILNIPIGTVTWIYSKALKKLKNYFTEEVDDE